MNDRLGIAWLFAALVSLFLGQIGASDKSRTYNFLITNEVLYH